jgi:hypothetical protein
MAEAPQKLTPEQKALADMRDEQARKKMGKAYREATVYPETQDVLKKAKGGKIRGCGCEIKGKTKGRFV